MVRLKHQIIFSCLAAFCWSQAQALTLNGFTEFANLSPMNAATAGTVQSIAVQPGQKVSSGDLLIKLDATPYQARYEGAQALANALKPAFNTAQLELDRAQELYDRDSLSQVELQNAQNKVAAADGKLKAALAEVALTRYQLQQASIHSPMNARVVKVHTFRGQYVDPAVDSTALITLVSSTSMKAVAVLNSDQWKAELMNKKARVKFRSQVYQGKVTELGYNRVEQSSGLPAFEVHISFTTDDLIPAEMPVSIEIED
jgi:RND family efflux transporter MFP subunit